MPETCRECGAAVPDGGSCRDHFHALLLLEGEIPGVAGSILHFYAVASYALQHPDGMNYTGEALAGVYASLADTLDGRVDLNALRHRVRGAANGPARVTRREGEPAPEWRRGGWPVTVADVCTADTFGTYDTYDEYAEAVLRWARSVRAVLDEGRV